MNRCYQGSSENQLPELIYFHSALRSVRSFVLPQGVSPVAKDKVNVAIIGLGFGAEFIPIYQRHPHANMYAICQRTEMKLNEVGKAFGVEKRYTKFEDVLADPAVDFVHI